MFGAKINRQPGPLNEDALQMLRDKGLKKFAKVITSDDTYLGEVVHLRLRMGEADVDLKLYAAYLDVTRLEIGARYYVPTDFVAGYEPEEERVVLSVPFSVVQDESWDRQPQFIAGHLDQVEALA